MPVNRRQLCAAACAGLTMPWGRVRAQGANNWPGKPLRLITPYPPAGLADQITRFVAERISAPLGQPVIVDNRPGAGAMLGTGHAARAAPDGYSFLVAPTAAVAIAPWLRKADYTAGSFDAIAKLASSYGLATARMDAPFEDYKGFAAAARAAPGKYSFASNGVGTIVHLTAVLLHKQAGIEVVHVPYKGSAAAMTDLIGGHVDIMYDPVTLPRVKSADLRGLMTIAAERNPEIPQVPTLAQSGFNIDTRSWFGIFAPKGTPAGIGARMAWEVHNAINAPDARSQLLISAMYPDFEGPTAFARRVREDSLYFRDLILREGIQAD